MNTRLLYNYLVVTFLSIRKQPVFSAIKILSLTLGLVCSLLVLAHVQYIYSFDRHFDNWENIYRLVGSTATDYNSTADPYAERLVRDYGQINDITSLRADSASFLRSGRSSTEALNNSFFWVEPSIFDVFSLDLVQGDSDSALDQINSIVLSESTARKFFGDDDPLGQTLTFNNQVDLRVTAVMRDLPVNTYLQIEAMISVATGQQINGADFMNLESWTVFRGTQTFFSVSNQAEAQVIANDLDNFLDRNIIDSSRPYAEQVGLYLALEPLSSVYLSPRQGYNSGGPIRARIFYGLIFFAFLVLLTSCINFVSLSMSQLEQRSKEIGIRKAIGADNQQVFIQFLLESLVLTVVALGIALPVVQFLVPVYTSLTGTAFTIQDMLQSNRLVILIGFVFATGLLAGILPAVSTTHMQPTDAVKGSLRSGRTARALRSFITTFQFSLSGTLVLLAVGIGLLVNHLNTMEIGFNRNNLVVLDQGFTLDERRANYASWDRNINAMINDLRQSPAIVAAAEGTVAPPSTGWFNSWGLLNWPEDRSTSISSIGVDENYLETMQLQLIAGRDFSQDFPADFMEGEYGDSDRLYGAILTRSALETFEFNSPEEALGATLHWRAGVDYKYRVVGVVEDFHSGGGFEQSGRQTQILWATNQPGFFTILRIDPLQIDSALEHIDQVWAIHKPGTQVARSFVGQTYDEMIYERTNSVSKASQFAAIVAICIAAAGLFALASFATQRRTKEIGIRKTVGATISDIIRLLSWDFLKPVLTACLLSCGFGYITVSYFFTQFSSYPDISLEIYLLVSAATLFLAMLTVSVQCYLAASVNPVESLKYE